MGPRVSNKGLRNPNSPCIIIIISVNKFSKSIAIIPSQKDIRWIVHAVIIRRGNHLFCDGFLSNLLLSLFLLLVPFLHKCDLLLRRSSLVLLLLVLVLLLLLLLFLLRGIKTDSLLGHTFLFITQKLIQVLFALITRHKTFLKLIFQLFVLNK